MDLKPNFICLVEALFYVEEQLLKYVEKWNKQELLQEMNKTKENLKKKYTRDNQRHFEDDEIFAVLSVKDIRTWDLSNLVELILNSSSLNSSQRRTLHVFKNIRNSCFHSTRGEISNGNFDRAFTQLQSALFEFKGGRGKDEAVFNRLRRKRDGLRNSDELDQYDKMKDWKSFCAVTMELIENNPLTKKFCKTVCDCTDIDLEALYENNGLEISILIWEKYNDEKFILPAISRFIHYYLKTSRNRIPNSLYSSINHWKQVYSKKLVKQSPELQNFDTLALFNLMIADSLDQEQVKKFSHSSINKLLNSYFQTWLKVKDHEKLHIALKIYLAVNPFQLSESFVDDILVCLPVLDQYKLDLICKLMERNIQKQHKMVQYKIIISELLKKRHRSVELLNTFILLQGKGIITLSDSELVIAFLNALSSYQENSRLVFRDKFRDNLGAENLEHSILAFLNGATEDSLFVASLANLMGDDWIQVMKLQQNLSIEQNEIQPKTIQAVIRLIKSNDSLSAILGFTSLSILAKNNVKNQIRVAQENICEILIQQGELWRLKRNCTFLMKETICKAILSILNDDEQGIECKEDSIVTRYKLDQKMEIKLDGIKIGAISRANIKRIWMINRVPVGLRLFTAGVIELCLSKEFKTLERSQLILQKLNNKYDFIKPFSEKYQAN